MNRRLIASGREIQEFVGQLKEISRDPSGWSSRYVDPGTGEIWERAILDDRRQVYALTRLPAPTQPELLDLALFSPHDNEAIAAIYLLRGDPKAQFKLFHEVEKMSLEPDACWDRVGLVIAWAGLESSHNRWPTLGKTIAEITADHQMFIDLARRAHILRLEAERRSGHSFERSLTAFA